MLSLATRTLKLEETVKFHDSTNVLLSNIARHQLPEVDSQLQGRSSITMGCFIHVRTCHRIFSPKVRAAFGPEILNLIRNIFRRCTNTLHITKEESVIVFQKIRKQKPESVKMFGEHRNNQVRSHSSTYRHFILNFYAPKIASLFYIFNCFKIAMNML